MKIPTHDPRLRKKKPENSFGRVVTEYFSLRFKMNRWAIFYDARFFARLILNKRRSRWTQEGL